MGRLDKGKADEAVAFIRQLKHTKDRWAGVPFDLQPWQEKIVRELLGTVNKDGTRQYRTAYISMARKNGKSSLAAAMALYVLFVDGDQGAEVYTAAAEQEQAGIIFEAARKMVEQDPYLRKLCKVVPTTKRIVRLDTGGVLRALSAESASKHGYNPSAVLYDELHVAPNRDLWDALTTGSGTRRQPLHIALTTAGYDRHSICWEQYTYAGQVMDGTVQDPTFYAAIFELPEDADWTQEKNWRLANPGLGSFLSLEEMRGAYKKALAIPALQNTFRRLRLNQWVQQATRWIDIGTWDEQAGLLAEETLVGRPCYGGLDLASVSDMTAWVMAFPGEEDPDEIRILCRFWVPEARLTDAANRYADQYRAWVQGGWLQVTPGGVTDYGFVRKQILEDAQRYNLVDLNVDRLFQAHQLAAELADALGEERVIGMGMGHLSMAAPMHELQRRLLAGKLRHGGNPVLRWMAGNLAVKQDAGGNLKPDKATSQGKIDGMVALVMALDRAMRHGETTSIYETRGIQ